ncbi:uncharacterized protein LOC132282018 [Cornus florida]|uniref:uncharacterized protein LOC132282018 n=1 Tax=Cornus florida TaxID=4283 RepID=UPI0028A1A548|nr:uncharacterized protein LOC132282018 [Cornus florida]
MTSQGLVVDGGGERNGIVGIVVGMVGIEGIVGSEVAGNGGKGLFGNGGSVALGMVGIAGNGGNVTLGIEGIVGSVGAGSGAEVCKRWRAAELIRRLESDNTMVKHRTTHGLEATIVQQEQKRSSFFSRV